jgi:hypothetical protein
MGDDYTALVDQHATRGEARSLGEKVLRVLIEEQIVREGLDSEAVFGERGGYRPGERIPRLYTGRASARFWELQTSGMETRPWVNVWGIPQLQGWPVRIARGTFHLIFLTASEMRSQASRMVTRARWSVAPTAINQVRPPRGEHIRILDSAISHLSSGIGRFSGARIGALVFRPWSRRHSGILSYLHTAKSD